MSEQISPIQPTKTAPSIQSIDQATSYLAQEFNTWKIRFGDQPTLTQRFLEAQGRKLADALIQHSHQARFTLPDKVVVASPTDAGEKIQIFQVPSKLREQAVVGLLNRLRHQNLDILLRQRLDELESHANPPVKISAGLIRYATATHMVHNMLPAGRTVGYQAAPDEEIPPIPLSDD